MKKGAEKRAYFDSADHYRGRATGVKQPSIAGTHPPKRPLPIVELEKEAADAASSGGGGGGGGDGGSA